jgi:hypothetical protein
MTPTYFALIVLVAAVFARGERMVMVFIVACLFGGSAAVTIGALGGAPLTPAVFALPFLLFHAIRTTSLADLVRHATDRAAGLWLLVLSCWGVASAIFLPRLFADQVMVLTVNRNSTLGYVVLVPLAPNSGNLTQTGYALGGFVAFVALRSMLAQDPQLKIFCRAVMVLASANIVAAGINLAELFSGVTGFMEVIRNADYAILDGVIEGGLFRISGTFPETSAFAAFTVPLFAFTASLARSGGHGKWPGVLAAVSFALLAFSTSSTAYATLIIYFGIVACGAAWRVLVGGREPSISGTVVIVWGTLVTVCCMVLFVPTVVDRVIEFFELTVYLKLETSSGIERSSWNAQAWSDFVGTYGIGAGLGSTRASSFLLVLLSNVGVIGTVLFVVFVGRVLWPALSRSQSPGAAVSRAAGHAMVAGLIASSISGTVYDIGMMFYVYAAGAAAIAGGAVRRAPTFNSVGMAA